MTHTPVFSKCGHQSGGGKPVSEERRVTGHGGGGSRQLSSVSSGHRCWSQERKPLKREKTADADTGVVTNASSTCFELQYPSRKVNSLMK